MIAMTVIIYQLDVDVRIKACMKLTSSIGHSQLAAFGPPRPQGGPKMTQTVSLFCSSVYLSGHFFSLCFL